MLLLAEDSATASLLHEPPGPAKIGGREVFWTGRVACGIKHGDHRVPQVLSPDAERIQTILLGLDHRWPLWERVLFVSVVVLSVGALLFNWIGAKQ